MTIEPERTVGPPKRCRRCNCLAECPIEFSGCAPDSNGVQQTFSGYICEDCHTVGVTDITEFFDYFRRK